VAAELPPIPPPPPIGRVQIVDDEGRATPEFAQWLAKLMHYLGHLTPPPPPVDPLNPRSILTLAEWLRVNVP